MRKTSASVFRSSPAAGTVLGLVLAATLVAAPSIAAPEVDSGCPTNLDCNSRIAKLLGKGAARSERLRSLVDFLGRHPDVELELRFRRQERGKHAQSFLTVRGIYVRDGEETKKRVTGVTGEVVIPLMAYGHEQIARLAHELQHVRVLLEGEIAMGSSEAEQAVIDFEQLVRAEIDSFEAGEPTGARIARVE